MSKAESWTLSHFSDQMKALSGGWKAKLPFLRNWDYVKLMKFLYDTDHVKQFEKLQSLVDAMMEVLGSQAGVNELEAIGKKEKV